MKRPNSPLPITWSVCVPVETSRLTYSLQIQFRLSANVCICIQGSLDAVPQDGGVHGVIDESTDSVRIRVYNRERCFRV